MKEWPAKQSLETGPLWRFEQPFRVTEVAVAVHLSACTEGPNVADNERLSGCCRPRDLSDDPIPPFPHPNGERCEAFLTSFNRRQGTHASGSGPRFFGVRRAGRCPCG